MKLQEFLNKFTNEDFLLSVDGLCDELSFYEYEVIKDEEYFKKYKDRSIKSIAILMTNDQAELCIHLK